jgi:aminoglycoside phosphotransferase (APT) family kinase protein
MTPVLPVDKVLPHLPIALEPTLMKEVFYHALLKNDSTLFSLEFCSIERIKYKPGQNCMISYRLHLQHRLSGQRQVQLVCARFYPQGDSHSRYEKAKREILVRPVIGEAIVHVPELELVIWMFPNDRKLQHISKLTDDRFLKEALLPSVMAAHLGPEWTITELYHELVHYAPEHTCTVRAHLKLENHQGKMQALTLYGKTYDGNQGIETYRLMQLLWNSQARKNGLLNTAKPLSYHPHYTMLWQQGLSGQPLITLNPTSSAFTKSLIQVARSVATLHQMPLGCRRKVTSEDGQQKLRTMTECIAQVKPDIAIELEGIVYKLLNQAKHLGKQPQATLHGDLHWQNFLIDNGTISVIDLDNVCQGSPWQDIGSFIAALYYRGLLENIPLTTIDHLSKTFCNAYALASPWKLDQDAIRWYTAMALITERVFRSITRLKAGRQEILEGLLHGARQFSQIPELGGL